MQTHATRLLDVAAPGAASGDLRPHLVAPGGPATHAALLELALVGTLLLAGVLVALSLVAFARRRTLSTLLIAAAFATVLGHALVAALMLGGVVSDPLHHLVEHVLVVVQSGLVLTAIYYARTIERRYRGDERVGGDRE